MFGLFLKVQGEFSILLYVSRDKEKLLQKQRDLEIIGERAAAYNQDVREGKLTWAKGQSRELCQDEVYSHPMFIQEVKEL